MVLGWCCVYVREVGGVCLCVCLDGWGVCLADQKGEELASPSRVM